ncbi:MAG: alpha/beta hydrolase [Woeseiaceae bacterium]
MAKVRDVMLKLILVLAAAYGFLVVAVYLMQGRMLYLADVPGRTLTMTPSDVGMDYEDVFIETIDGVTLHGWFIPGRSARVLLFFHGNAGNISHRLESIRQFRDLGMSVLIVDYRGYGQSNGRTSETGLYRDADAAWRYLIEDRGLVASDIVIFGRSLGASVASRLAARQQPRALIVESSFTSIPDIAQELYPWLPARWLSRLKHATREHIRDVRCPVLVVHSRDDEIIPYHHGEAIFASANEPRTLLTIRGTHNDAFLRDERAYTEGLETFLAGLSNPGLLR